VAMGGDWSAKSARGGGNQEEAYLREGKGEALPDTAARRGPAATGWIGGAISSGAPASAT
jgi:hypothetical protein